MTIKSTSCICVYELVGHDQDGSIWNFDYNSTKNTANIFTCSTDKNINYYKNVQLSSTTESTLLKPTEKLEKAHNKTIRALAAHPFDKKIVASASFDTTVAIWQMEDDNCLNQQIDFIYI